MSWFTVPIDLAIGFVGVAIGELHALNRIARRAPKKVRHEHAFDPWEITGETTYHKGDHLPIQQRRCMTCGFTEREAIFH